MILSRGVEKVERCIYRNKREREKERGVGWKMYGGNDGSVLVGVFEDDRYGEF